MEVLKIRGGNPLHGAIAVSGAKNAALPIFAATLLTDEECVIDNVPDLSDVRYLAEILQCLGAQVWQEEAHRWKFKAECLNPRTPYELVRKMRASVCLMGPLVGRLRSAEVSLPGGCVIGPRPIDLHLKGLGKLNCGIEIANGYVHIDGKSMRGADIFLGGRHGPTVTGTANILMASVLAPGRTRIESAACEPEIVDLCGMLNAMGANITGVGSHHLTVEGVEKLHGCRYRIISDRIEAGTFLLAGAITGGDLTVSGAQPKHLSALFDKLEEAHIETEINQNGDIRVLSGGKRKPVDLITLPHPAFPTDLQAQMCAVMSLTPGLSILTEKIYPNRFMHVPELQRMGADIAMEGPSAIINGKESLSGAPVMASDLRASAALILAALAAQGETWIQRIYHIDRGYERIDERLHALGADIVRMPASEMPKDMLVEA